MGTLLAIIIIVVLIFLHTNTVICYDYYSCDYNYYNYNCGSRFYYQNYYYNNYGDSRGNTAYEAYGGGGGSTGQCYGRTGCTFAQLCIAYRCVPLMG